MRRSSVVAAVLATTAALVVSVAAGEVAVRAAHRWRGFYDVEMWRYSRLLKVDPGWPGVPFWHRPGARVPFHGFEIVTNRFGMRSPEIDEQPPPGVRRVAVLGDSITLGWGVPSEEAFPALCARLLQRMPSDGPRVEVLNFGIGNANTAMAAALHEALVRRFGASEVVLAYFVNDAELLAQSSSGRSAWGSELVVWTWSRLLRVRSRFDPSARYDAYYAGLYRDDAPGWIAARSALVSLARRVRDDGARLTVLLIPELHRLEGSNPFGAAYDQVATLARREGAEVVDLWPAFEGREPRSLWVSDEDAHPNRAGHEVIAREMAAHLSAGAGPRGQAQRP